MSVTSLSSPVALSVACLVLALLLLAGPLSFYSWYVYSESARQIDAELRDRARLIEQFILKTSVADVHCGQNAGRLWVWR